MKFRYLIMISIMIFPAIAMAGTSYYVDSSQTDPKEDGSFLHPWNSIDDVNKHQFFTGDDVYFKAGSYIEIPEGTYLDIDWGGSPNDRVVIGAYSWDGVYNTMNARRPILNGKFKSPGGDTKGIICAINQVGYITIQDLEITESSWNGIEISYSYTNDDRRTLNNQVLNCYTKNTVGKGILFGRASYGLIADNIVERASYNRMPGGAIVVSGANNENVSQYNTITGNIVYWCYEGIGVYLGSRYTTVSNNIVYDCRSYHIYVANSRDAVIENNVVYETPNQLPGDGKDLLIGTDSEGHIDSVIKVTGNVTIVGNYIAGGNKGISIMSNSNEQGLFQTGNVINDNIIIDCEYNFYFDDSRGWSDNQIYNNISSCFDKNFKHANLYSPEGVIWGNNTFNSEVTGNATTEVIIGNVMKKTSGWSELIPGSVSRSQFDTIHISSPTGYISPPAGLKIVN